MTTPVSLRLASALLWTTAVGFGTFCIPAIRSLWLGRGVPIVMGFPAYGHGPFERIGIPTTPALVAGFLLVCLLEGLAGWLVWGGHRSGAILAVALLPAGAVYWWGFALPFPPVLAIVRTILIVANWRALN